MKRLYRVSFFKKLTDTTGHTVDAVQGTVDVECHRRSRAIRSARRKFAKLKDVSVWTLRADYERVDIMAHRRREFSKPMLGMGNLDDLLALT